MTRISQLKDITPEETAIFKRACIETTEALWERVAGDRDAVFRTLQNDGLPYNRERILLAAGAELPTGRSELARHLPDLLIVAVVVVLAIISVRAAGRLSILPSPWNLPDRVAIASHDLAANQVIEQGDLYLATLPRGTSSFTSTALLQGLVISHTVTRLQPLRFADVLRLQVVATSTITAGTSILTGSVALQWSPFSRTAELALNGVVGHKSSRALYAGSVVTGDAVVP